MLQMQRTSKWFAHASRPSPTFSCITSTCKNKAFAADNSAHYMKACTYMVLLGHPGIGKSMAVNYLVHRLLKVGRSVVVLKNTGGATSVHVFNCANETVDVTKWNALSPIPILSCLLDAHDETQPPPQQRPVVLQDGHQIDHYLPRKFDCVLSCSPKKSNWHESCKQCIGRTYYIPTWSSGEMKLANTHKLFLEDELPAKVLETRMEWAGGIVRNVFRKGDVSAVTNELVRVTTEAACLAL